MKNKILILVLLSAFLGSCKKTVVTLPDSMVPVRIAVTAPKPHNSVASRAISTDGFMTFSQMGIYSVLSSTPDLGSARNANAGYGNSKGALYWEALNPAAPIYYPEDKSPINLYGYHPYTGQVNSTVKLVGGVAALVLEYTLPLNQSEVATITTADLMWGSAVNVVPSTTGVATLEFVHKLTKVTFLITLSDAWGTESVPLNSVKMYGGAIGVNCSMVVANGALTTQPNAAGQINTVYCDYATPIPLDRLNVQKCEFIAIPNADIAGTTFEFNVSGVSYKIVIDQNTVANAADRSFDSGSNRVFSVKINTSGSTDELNVVPDILDWSVVNNVDLDGI